LPDLQDTTVARDLIFGEVDGERRYQIAKWGTEHQTHPHTRATIKTWRLVSDAVKEINDALSQDEISWEDILWEEVAEAFAETAWPARRTELIQVMAVACAEIEDGDAKTADEVGAMRQKRQEARDAAMRRHPASQAHPGDSEQNAAGAST
jgi:transcriptional regulator of acetoin/glycerol metabolism